MRDVFRGQAQASVTVGDGPLGVDVDPVTNLAFVVSTDQNRIYVIDGSNNTLKTVVDSVPGLYVAANPGTQTVYVSGINGVTVINEE
jgi:DNA-binding beta-propeller fold protein YncE